MSSLFPTLQLRRRNPGRTWRCAPVLIAIAALPALAAPKLPDAARKSEPEKSTVVLSAYEAKQRLKGADVVAKWLDDGSSFVFRQTTQDGTRFLRVDPVSDASEPLFDHDRLERALRELRGSNAALDDVVFSSVEISPDESKMRFEHSGRAVELDFATYDARYVSDGVATGRSDPALPRVVVPGFPATWPDQREIPSPDGVTFLGLTGHDLSLRSVDGQSSMLTADGDAKQPWLLHGASWSPDGRKLAAIRADATHLDTLSITDWLDPRSEPQTVMKASTGGRGATYGGAIFDRERGTRVDFSLGDAPYVRVVGWRPDATELLVAKLSRDATRLQVVAIDAATGSERTVLREQTGTFLYFPPNFTHRNGIPFHPLRDNEHFVWGSERSGWMQYYLYSLDGEYRGPITRGEYPVVQFGGETPDGRILYTASPDASRPYDVHVFSARLDGTEMRQLSRTVGQHDIQVSPSGSFYLDKHSTSGTLPSTELRRNDGSLVRLLSQASLPRGATFLEPEHFTARAADGTTDIYGVIFKPAGFDPRKSYPVVENIYAGPFVTYVPWRFDSRQPYYGTFLFENGYVEVVIDGRGTPGRGKQFQDVAYRNLGRHEIADHAAALEQAALTRPWMDMCRVGVFGNSYGGFFALRALLQAPDVYHVAVAAGTPVRDRNDSAAATEAYLGRYSPESEAWRQASNLPLIPRLRGNLLLVQGTSDVNTPMDGALKIAHALISANKPFDMLVLPNVNHHYRGADFSNRTYMEQAIVRYFDEHLKPNDCNGDKGGARQ